MTTGRTEIFYGVVCGAGMCCWVLLEYALGFHTTSLEIGQYSGYGAMVFPVVVIFAAMRERQAAIGTSLPWVDGISIGFRIALFSAILLSLFFYIYNTYINPEWIELTVEWQRKKLIIGGATDDEIGRFMDQNRRMNNSFTQVIMGSIGWTGIGVVITLIEIPIVRFLKSH
ncbi:MAG: DUF4199 domain-containing protein [Bacteroidota bacterium]